MLSDRNEELACECSYVLKADSHSTNGYTITSAYFDDLCDSYLRDTIDGNRLRQKYRIRIYNRSFEEQKG